MRSTGNDIVALAATDEGRTCGVRFYSRILTPGEVVLYEGLADEQLPDAELADRFSGRPAIAALAFSSFVWLMWSIKESAFKYVSRANRHLVFAPLKIPVIQVVFRDDHYEGVLRYGRMILYSRSFLGDGMIMTVVSEEKDFSGVRCGVRVIGDSASANQSAQVRAFALESLAGDFPGADLRIVKSVDGPPEVWDGGQMLDVPVSFAHHDRYVAWSYRF